MTAGTPTVGAAGFVEPPELRRATFADFPAIHRLESEFLPNIFDPDDRRRLFEDNPLWPRVAHHWPVGWVMEDDDGVIVGAVTNVPSAYRFRGEEKVCANGLAWVAAEAHRGYAPMLMDQYFNQEEADLVLSSNVGVNATGMWQAYGTAVPLGDWSRAAYTVTDRRSFARSAMGMQGIPFAGALAVPAAGALAAKDAITPRPLPRTPDGVEIVEHRAFDDRFDAFWDELLALHHDTMLAVRDRATLEWHYGQLLRSGRLWIHTAERDGRIRAFCVVRQYDRPGGMRSMKIVDYQSVDTTFDLLPGLVRAAAARASRDGYSILEHNGCDIPKMRTFDAWAPYRLTKAAWSFYYRTLDPVLLAALADPGVWDPSEYDGDTSFT